MSRYVEVTREQARDLIEALHLEGTVNVMMGGTFWYPHGSPTGYPHVAVAWYPEERITPTGPVTPAVWKARSDLLGEAGEIERTR